MLSRTRPAFLPYRDPTGAIKYTTSPSSSLLTTYNTSAEEQPSTHLYNTYLSPYDSDVEPLIPNTSIPSELSEYDLNHFTATGRPAPTFKASGLASLCGHMLTAPQLLPQRYTDDSIIPAIVVDVIPSPALHLEKEKRNKRRGSLLNKLKPGVLKGSEERRGSGSGRKEEKGIMKVAFMPRREYLKYFARGLNGEYIGSEPYRRWSEEELEREYGVYKPASMQKKKRKS
ncbi:hypothetical protein EG329_010631 [Mollisiaceae sp. DMI_Dod_QoI]|nr:hypothetical protein EG329_010631 [Helotiales sp. DMI_Dod_QoI]